VGTSAGPDRDLGQHPLDRATFLRDLEACVSDWGQTLAGRELVRDQRLTALLQRTTLLQNRSEAVGFGGIGHHLGRLLSGTAEGQSVEVLREPLGVVRAIQAQAREALSLEEAAIFAQGGGRGADHLASGSHPIAPPRMITHVNARERSSSEVPAPPRAFAPPSPVPPPPLTPAAAPFTPAVPRMGDPLPPRMLFESQLGVRPPDAPQFPAPAAGFAPPHPLNEPALGPNAPHAPLPVAPQALSPKEGEGGRPGGPNLFVRSLLGLRAPGRRRDAMPVAPAMPPHPEKQPSSPLLNLKSAAHGDSGSRAPKPPPPLTGYAGLPSLPREPDQRPSHRSLTPPHVRQSSPPPRGGGRSRLRNQESEGRWWVGALAVVGVGLVVAVIVVIAVVVSRRSSREETAATAPAGPSASVAGQPSAGSPDLPALPRSRLLNDNERFRSLLAQVHGRGKETAELRALVDEQAAIAAQAALGTERCVGQQCAALREVSKLVTAGEKKAVRRRARSPDALRSRWLAGLEMPEIPVEDDPLVQKRFEFYTENAVGRETFQQMLFRCGAFRDSIQAALIRRGLPSSLLAVVFAESGCSPTIRSPAGAEGLWQFIPEAARAYHLRIIPDIVDERHSPQKSTEAAVRFLADMYGKLGSWDLVFAGYNMGPFGLMARLERVEGSDVGFWDLVDAGMLPDETANYAPTIQAIALILNNLQRLKFAGGQMRAPEVTLELEVPPNTRLSLIARAAAMSVNELRRLNLDLKAGMTPNVPNFVVHVPKDSVWQARETLTELLKSKDESDQCVPPSFDWGRQRFTPDMAKACAANLAAAGAQPAPAPAAP
jgi:hypothetical protein